MPELNRTMKVAVVFDGWRSKDLKGKEGLWYRLAVAQGELTEAANKTMAALFALKMGTIPFPKRDDGSNVPIRSLTYQALSGKWQPFGEPLYRPKGRRLSSAVLLEIATLIDTRLREDWLKVVRGERSLPTFHTLPLGAPKANITIHDDGRVTFPVWDGRKNNRITIKAVRVRGGQRTILRRIADGVYTHGNCRLTKDKRKGKWMLSLSWKGDVKEAEGTLVAGIDLGITTTVTLAYTDAEGKARPFRDTVQIPEPALRAWKTIERERRQRAETNKDTWELRTGRGRNRKIRPSLSIGEKRRRVIDTAVRQVAAATIKTMERRGVHTVVLEDLKRITDNFFDETADMSRKKAARARRSRLLKWQQHKLRTFIQEAAEKAGITVLVVPPQYTSKMCSNCGIVWTDTRASLVAERISRKDVEVQKPHDGLGRNGKNFKCSCGHKADADRNAAINIARRGIESSEGGVRIAAK